MVTFLNNFLNNDIEEENFNIFNSFLRVDLILRENVCFFFGW